MKILFVIVSTAYFYFSALSLAQEVPLPVQKPDVGPSGSGQPAWSTASACALALKNMNVKYKILPPIKQGSGCAIAEPLELSILTDGITLTPPAILDCPTALQFARFTRDVIAIKARDILGSSLVTIAQSSAFVCRNRKDSSKLSEHAYGRAIDISAFITKTGQTIPVQTLPPAQRIEAQFLDTVRAAACGPFSTVLGPGSDPDHEFHFHFDMAKRKSGAYCVDAAQSPASSITRQPYKKAAR